MCLLALLVASCAEADERTAGEICDDMARTACVVWASCDSDAPLVPECVAAMHEWCCDGVDCGATISVTAAEEERCSTQLSNQLCFAGGRLPEPCRNLRDRAPRLSGGGSSVELLDGPESVCRLANRVNASAVAAGGGITVKAGCGPSVMLAFAVPPEGGSSACATMTYQIGSRSDTCTTESYYPGRVSGSLRLTGADGLYRVAGSCKCGSVEARFDLPLGETQ